MREISTLDIKDIIRKPDFYRIEEDGIMVVTKEVKEKGKIGVVYKKLKRDYLILTIYYAK